MIFVMSNETQYWKVKHRLKIIGLVHERKVDFAVDPFGWRKDRLKVVDYLAMNKRAFGQIYIANPQDSYDWMVYLKPNTTDAWIAVSLFFLLIPPIMAVLMTDCKYLLINKASHNILKKDYTF